MRTLVVTLMLVCSAASLAAESHLRWYRGNTHAHTLNSVGDATPETVAQWYRDHDYQFLFITDYGSLTDRSTRYLSVLPVQRQ